MTEDNDMPKREPTLEEMQAYIEEHYAEATPALSTEDLHDLAVKIVTNEIYVAALGTEACTCSYGALLGLTPTHMIPRNLAALCSPLSAAMPMASNGYPVFLSAQWIPIESVEALRNEVVRLQEAMK